MKKHIEVCKKCDEQVKPKYLNRTAPDPEVDYEILEIEQDFNVTIDSSTPAKKDKQQSLLSYLPKPSTSINQSGRSETPTLHSATRVLNTWTTPQKIK